MNQSTKTSSNDSIKAQVLAVFKHYNAAVASGDAEGQLAFFSEQWKSESGVTKAEIRTALQNHNEPGSKRFVVDDAKVIIEGDTATIDPVEFRAPFGGGSFYFEAKRESDGAWRCLTMAGTKIIDVSAENARSKREQIMSDPARPGYHFVMPEGTAMPFDPNGAIYWKGRYHMFYIYQDTQLGKRSDH